MKGKYYIEITCKACEGTGLQKDEEGQLYAQEDAGNECLVCKGQGYVIDATDTSTGERLQIINF